MNAKTISYACFLFISDVFINAQKGFQIPESLLEFHTLQNFVRVIELVKRTPGEPSDGSS